MTTTPAAVTNITATTLIKLSISGTLLTVLSLAAYYGVQEHDARIRAEATIAQAQKSIADLQGQLTSNAKAATAKAAKIQKAAAAVTTPSQAIAAIPDISTVPLNPRTLPTLPATDVIVTALPLFQELAACRITEAKLDGCTAAATLTTQIDAAKDKEIVAIKKERPSIWHRVWTTAEIAGIAGLVGYAAHR